MESIPNVLTEIQKILWDCPDNKLKLNVKLIYEEEDVLSLELLDWSNHNLPNEIVVWTGVDGEEWNCGSIEGLSDEEILIIWNDVKKSVSKKKKK